MVWKPDVVLGLQVQTVTYDGQDYRLKGILLTS